MNPALCGAGWPSPQDAESFLDTGKLIILYLLVNVWEK